MKLISKIKRISLELSNLCPMAPFHKTCPAHIVKDHQVLSLSIIYPVIDFLAEHNYSEWISPFIYSEPMTDPRLFKILEYCRKKMPNCKIRILSSGYGVTQDLLNELAQIGIQLFKIDAYSKRDLDRFRGLAHPKIPRIKITRGSLDDRMKIYDLPEKNLNWPCYAPLAEINIKSDGTINLCCVDWDARYKFGNLHRDPFPVILKRLVGPYERLSKGNRFLPICKRCNRQILGYKCRRKTNAFE